MLQNFPRAGALAALALLLLLTTLLSIPAESSRPNVLLVTIDTLRADRLGAYGFVPARTETIDRLAREGTLFEEALSAAPITLPSHSTIMTGLLPPAHGVRDNGAYSLPDRALTLAERLRAAGYATQAFVSAVVLSKRYNINQGFDLYDDALWSEEDPRLFMIRERRASDTIDHVLTWFEQWRSDRRRAPFFTWVHLFDPHQPHQAPGWISASSPSGYDAEITYADRQLGRLIDALRASGELDRTLVVLTADHGESLGEHGEKTHAVFVYRATTHVPLILRYPKRFAPDRRVATPVHHVDIAPTVLATLGMPTDPGLQGFDLGAARSLPERALYSESLLSEVGFGMAPLFAVRERNHTFIRAPKPELYDLAVDPGETRNLHPVPGHRERADALDLSLQALLDRSGQLALGATRNPLSEESIEMLRSLGYLQSAESRAGVAGMDPKDGIHIYNQLEAARHAGQQAEWARSEEIARDILAQVPGHASARGVLALALLNQGRADEARDQYLQLIAQNPAEFRVHAMLGSIALRGGDLDVAIRHYQDALAAAPKFVEAMSGIGLVAMMRGDEPEAKSWFDRILAIDPEFPDVHRLLGDLYFEQERFADARAAYAKALALFPDDYRTLIQAAASARRADAGDEARTWLQQAVRLRPERWVAHYNLACLDAVQGRAEQAFAALEVAMGLEPDVVGLVAADEDWKHLRDDARLKALSARASEH
ncbi:MAG TPA: sulfatase-like hydrolase/transferase [Pseudomonadota bacterium]|jgi:choline-sulfatase|nr:sulfatase-like hydrolase/transferase [Pseudomonadota bacterium]